MFKVETVVGAVIVLILPISFAVSAQTTDETSTLRGSCASSEAALNAAILILNEAKRGTDTAIVAREQTIVDDYERRFNACVRTTGTEYANGGCDEAASAFNKAKGALSTACLTMGGGSSGDSSWPLCTKAVNQCDACPNENADKEGLDCDEVAVAEEEDPANSSASTVFGLRNVATGRMLFKYCPGKLGSEQKDLEKEMKESQKLVRELEDKLPKLQEEYADMVSATENEVSELQDQKSDATNRLDEQLEAARNGQDQAIKELQGQIAAIEESIARADDGLRQIALAKADAEMKYQETLKQIELNCHASASATVSKFQQDRMELERARKFNRQSFKNMLEQVGVSDREAWQKKAEKYYKWCLESKPTKDSKASARKQYESVLRTQAEAVVKLGRDKDRLREKIGTITSKNGCAAPGGGVDAASEPAMCGAMRMAQQQSERLYRQFDTEMRKLDRKVMQAQQNGARKAQAKLAEANVIQRQLNDERQRLDNFKEYLELAYKAGGGGNSADAKNYVDAKAKYGDFVAAASTLVSCSNRSDCDATTVCRDASAFLNNIKVHPGYKDEGAGEVAVDTPAEPETSR